MKLEIKNISKQYGKKNGVAGGVTRVFRRSIRLVGPERCRKNDIVKYYRHCFKGIGRNDLL